jgi:endonuclease/exonuclease/phosphatase family metal-dependent hydrolase
MGKPDVVASLVQIVRRYDIALLQEIRDISATNVVQPFLAAVNSASEDYTYQINMSDNLGRSAHKERYVYIYRNETVQVLQSYQYDDLLDSFEREPFSVLIRSMESTEDNPLEFFLLGVHIRPSDVCNELWALEQAYLTTSRHFNDAHGFLMGDFNADCNYLSGCSFQELPLVKDPMFSWLVDFSVDTTVKRTYCAYDRIIVGGGIADCIVPDSVQVFRFDVAYNLNQSEAENVSDHYPVEMELNSQCNCLESIKLLVFATTHHFAPSKGPHGIVIETYTELSGYDIVSSDFWDRSANELQLNLRSDFRFTTCVRKRDIKRVSIVPLSTDGWNVKTIVTFVCDPFSDCSLLTQDLDINYWVDSDGSQDGAPLVLSIV